MLKEQVLSALEQQKGKLVTGGRLAEMLGVSRTAVWKAVRRLQEEGNEISSVQGSGYVLSKTNDTLSSKEISEHLTTGFVGRSITLLPTVHSTNRYIKEADTESLADGYVVIADGQTEGRGRRGRAFVSPKSGGVYLSILLKPEKTQPDVRLLTICAAVAVSKAIEAVCGVTAGIKWVNDIYCGGKKICGILTEAVLSGELQELSTAIVGIGINTGSVPRELGGVATSVFESAGLRGIRNRLAAEVLNRFETEYLAFMAGDKIREMLDHYESRLFIRGAQVRVTAANGSYPATVLGVDETGALVVRDGGGATLHITAGEINN